MYAPIILENKKLCDSLVNEVKKACTIAIVGIGNMFAKSSLVQKNYILKSEANIFQNKNAVGEVCTHYFDISGNIKNNQEINPDYFLY
ncbi:hypothetical protein HMPREF1982_01500 [Clostridiales bacterium oral taxon 876 str. F0540]|nr:hypothetical protein HMPREF1982_01500 [Clostridiales bacterium oral taxon 876 str. F0540]